MSYLDLPRLHFGGIFYAGPSTINNQTPNYVPNAPVENPDGTYSRSVAGWYALGLAQWYFQNCTILGAADAAGRWIGSGDPLIGAALDTPSPQTPVSNGSGGTYDLAKLVDLDPDQQSRSEVYGLRLQVTLPDSSLFGGLMSVPQLRELGFSRAKTNVGGSFNAVGVLMGAIARPNWPSAISSPLLASFKNACGNGIAVSLTVDLHWNNPTVNQNGMMFLFGRVHGSMGPLLASETGQTLLGRRMSAQTGAPTPATSAITNLRESLAAAAQAAPAASAAAMPPWNAAYARQSAAGTQETLSVDLGMAIPLAVQDPNVPPQVNGKPFVESGIKVGVVDSTGKFSPLQNGTVSFANYYKLITSMEKNCYVWTNCGVFQIPLGAGESAALQSGALAVEVNGSLVMEEASSGTWIQVAQASARAQLPGVKVSIPMLVTKRGIPLRGYSPTGLQTVFFQWTLDHGNWTMANAPTPSNDLAISFQPATTGSDGTTSAVLTSTIPSMTLSQLRADLDSQVYFIMPPADATVCYTDGNSNPVISVLLWQSFTPPAKPTWAADIAPIMQSYAKLYPGMRAKVDMGDPAVAKANAGAIAGRMALPISDPSFMPVTRDLSPAKTKMVVDFMANWAAS